MKCTPGYHDETNEEVKLVVTLTVPPFYVSLQLYTELNTLKS